MSARSSGGLSPTPTSPLALSIAMRPEARRTSKPPLVVPTRSARETSSTYRSPLTVETTSESEGWRT